MQLSPAAELAIRGIMVLAEEFGKGPVTLDTICEKRKLPKQYLVKIFGLLNRVNLITTIRGKKGGYQLSRAPEKISLLEVIEAVEGKIAMNYCQQDPSKCERYACPVRPVWDEIQEFNEKKLASTSLDKCIGLDNSFNSGSTPPEN